MPSFINLESTVFLETAGPRDIICVADEAELCKFSGTSTAAQNPSHVAGLHLRVGRRNRGTLPVETTHYQSSDERSITRYTTDQSVDSKTLVL